MPADLSSENREKTPVGADLLIPGAAIAFTLYYFSTIIDSPWTAQVSAFFVGSILLALCLILLASIARRVARGEASLRFDPLITPAAVVPKRLALFGLTLGYIFFIDWLGFTTTTFLFLMFGMMLLSGWQRNNKRLIVILSAVLSVGGYLLFVVAFERRFPEGPFEDLFKAVVSSLTGA